MKMKSLIAVFVLCLATSAYQKYPEWRGDDQETRIDHGISCTPWIQADQEKNAVGPEPWTDKQLMAPADLAATINDPAAKKPVIICVGPGALISGSLDMGPAKENENLEKLKLQLSKLSRNTNLVIYCGCCPFEHCPNIRPAFKLLNEMKFNNAHLLNIEHNLKADWIARGYPQKA
jgi:thiosulfate/3-mercaptopyruvate sulfurtransferase